MATNSAFRTGLSTFRSVMQNPTSAKVSQNYRNRVEKYEYRWSWYDGTVFDTPAFSVALRADERLYRQTRIIYNHVTRLDNFWASIIYPGVLSPDGMPLSKTTPIAIPLSDKTPDELKAAVAQFWQWSNWQLNKGVRCLYGAVAGDVLTEIIDEGGTISAQVWWPSMVCDVQLDNAGNVRSYALEYMMQDKDDLRPYVYRKEVDKYTFRTFKDDTPFDYSIGSTGHTWENPYGFVPAVWDRHTNVGTVQGVPAIGATLKKLLELNSLISHAHDQVHKVIGAPVILWSDDDITNLLDTNTKRDSTDTLTIPDADRESMLILKGGPGGRKDTLVGDLDLGAVLNYGDRLLHEIERDHPELIMYDELRAMSQVTGPAAEALLGDVKTAVVEVRAGYDMNSIKLFQMAAAIGGFRAGDKTWLTYNRENGRGDALTPQQAKFATFSLDSYHQDQLSMWIEPRPLVPDAPPSALDKANINAIKKTYGVSDQQLQREDGYTEAQIEKMAKEKAESDAARLAMANFAVQGGGDAPPDLPGAPEKAQARGTASGGGQTGNPRNKGTRQRR